MDNNNLTNDSDTSVQQEELFDYYNIGHRIPFMLKRPYDVMAVILGFIAILFNVLMLVALFHVRSRITTHFRLIISLAVSDMVVGASVLFYVINKALNPTYTLGKGPHHQRLSSRCVFMVIKSINNAGLNITLLNLMLMAVDHYVAIMTPLKYPLIVLKTRVRGVLILAWIVSLVLGFSDFFVSIKDYYFTLKSYGYNFCECVWLSTYHEEYTVFTIAPLCFLIMMYCYTRIYSTIHKRRIPGAEATSQRNDLRRSRKALVTTLFALGSFLLTWLPLCFFQITLIVKAYSHPQFLQDNQNTFKAVDRYLYNLLVLNSIIDPIIYTARTQEVRLGLQRLCGCFGKCSEMTEGQNEMTERQSMRTQLIHTKLEADVIVLDEICIESGTKE